MKTCGLWWIALGLTTMLGGAAAAAENPRLERSRAIAASFQAELQQALQAAMAEGGPMNAVRVCKDEAPRIASTLSRQSGAKVSRTSLRYRNPANAPEPWQREWLAELEAAGPVSVEQPRERFAVAPEGDVRYLRAIRTGPLCLACHGAELAPQVRDLIDELYPQDRARGYAPGDVRGAFSVVWPPEG